MHTRARWALLMAAAGCALAALSAPPAAATVRQHRLLVRYQPVTVLDPLEIFAPTTVASFVADANLETQTAPNTWALVTAAPSLADLPATPTPACVAQALVPCYRLNQRDCSPAGGAAALACFAADWLAPAPRSMVYGRATRAGRATVLQYWYFYYEDLYSYHYPPDDFIWQAHEGDWEAVTILLRAGAAHPRWVGYSQHCTGERRAWADVPRWHGSTHPVAYVAVGSHATEFGTGDHPIAVECIPPQAIQLLRQQGLALPVDHANAGAAFGPPHAAGVTPTGLVRVRRTSPSWMRFAGTWGEYQYFHGPSPINTVPSGSSPPSPPFHELWQHPVRTIFSWPKTG